MYIATKPNFPNSLYLEDGFDSFVQNYQLGCGPTPIKPQDIPVRERWYTKDFVFWREPDDSLYQFLLSPSELTKVWWQLENGVVVDKENGCKPVEIKRVYEVELLFSYR